MYLRRAVDDEGEVLDLVMRRRRDTDAALKLIKRLLRNQAIEPEHIVTDGLGSYPAALGELGLLHLHHPERLRENDRAENSHLPIRKRERQQLGFKIRGFRAAVSHHPRCDLQHLLSATAFNDP